MLLLAMLLLAGDEDVVTTAVETYREKTRADVPCRATADQTEVIVCMRRDADRYRDLLIARYGEQAGRAVQYAEAFEGCEYGAPLTEENIGRLFPF